MHSDIAALTNAEGRFHLGRLVPGSYTLAIHSSGGVPTETDVVVMPGQQAEMTIRLDHRLAHQPEAAASLEVRLITNQINWLQVRLVRVSLSALDEQRNVVAAQDFFFSPTNSKAITWKIASDAASSGQYTYEVVYFLRNGTQKTVGPITTTNPEVILDPHA
jgi:hypothetical protein